MFLFECLYLTEARHPVSASSNGCMEQMYTLKKEKKIPKKKKLTKKDRIGVTPPRVNQHLGVDQLKE